MTALVTGGSGSGKSETAERIVSALGGEKFYIATMPILSAEDEKKAERHRKMRAGRGFATLERPLYLNPLPPDGATVLLECLSTHTANIMFCGEGCGEDAAERVWRSIAPLLDRRGHTVLVTAEAGGDGVRYGAETAEYLRTLAEVNRRVAEAADTVVECVCGIPIILKGAIPC